MARTKQTSRRRSVKKQKEEEEVIEEREEQDEDENEDNGGDADDGSEEDQDEDEDENEDDRSKVPPTFVGVPPQPWNTLPKLALTLIYEFTTKDGEDADNFALTCKCFHQMYASSFLSMNTDLRKSLKNLLKSNTNSYLKKQIISDMKYMLEKYEAEIEQHETLKEKKKEWNKFLHGSKKSKAVHEEAAKLLTTNLFDLVSYEEIEAKVCQDFRWEHRAEVKIGAVDLSFSSYSEEGDNLNWTMSLSTPKWNAYDAFALEDGTYGSYELVCNRLALDKIREFLNLTNAELIPNKLLIKALVLTLPWEFGSNYQCCYYDRAIVRKGMEIDYKKDEDEEKDEEEEEEVEAEEEEAEEAPKKKKSSAKKSAKKVQKVESDEDEEQEEEAVPTKKKKTPSSKSKVETPVKKRRG